MKKKTNVDVIQRCNFFFIFFFFLVKNVNDNTLVLKSERFTLSLIYMYVRECVLSNACKGYETDAAVKLKAYRMSERSQEKKQAKKKEMSNLPVCCTHIQNILLGDRAHSHIIAGVNRWRETGAFQ